MADDAEKIERWKRRHVDTERIQQDQIARRTINASGPGLSLKQAERLRGDAVWRGLLAAAICYHDIVKRERNDGQ